MGGDDWHLDKKVSISMFGMILSLFVGFFAQTVYLTRFITEWKVTTENRLTTLEKSESNQLSFENRIVVLEQQFSFIRSDLAEIKTLLREEKKK